MTIKRNGILVSVQKWDSHKLPVLAVSFEGENCIYKVASFNSEKTANWFLEIMEEFFGGLVTKAPQDTPVGMMWAMNGGCGRMK